MQSAILYKNHIIVIAFRLHLLHKKNDDSSNVLRSTSTLFDADKNYFILAGM